MCTEYEKFPTFLRMEVCSNNLADFALRKGLDHLLEVRKTFLAILERFTTSQAQSLNVHVDFPLFQRLALPVLLGKSRVPGIKIHDTRIVRLMEVLLHSGNHLAGWRTHDIHQAILTAYRLSDQRYTLTQLRYDIRKMKAHGLLQRDGRRYRYRLTEKGVKAALLFVLFHQRVCGPLANSLFHHQPDPTHCPNSKLEAAYHKADASIQRVIQLMAAA